jgi:Fe-S-cluster containining protein
MIQVAPEEDNRMGGYHWEGKCVLLIDNKCSVYEKRAFICRLFGSSEIMKCPDCTPERYLSKSETTELIKKYVSLK